MSAALSFVPETQEGIIIDAINHRMLLKKMNAAVLRCVEKEAHPKFRGCGRRCGQENRGREQPSADNHFVNKPKFIQCPHAD